MEPKAITHPLVLQIFTEVLLLLLVLYKFYTMSLFIYFHTNPTPNSLPFPSPPVLCHIFFLNPLRPICVAHGCLFSYWRVVKLPKATLLEKTLFPSART